MTASLAAIALGTQKAQAQTDTDSLRMEELQEVVVRGVKARLARNYRSSLHKHQACWHGARTEWEQAQHICASAVLATRASTSLSTVCHSTLPKTNACSGQT